MKHLANLRTTDKDVDEPSKKVIKLRDDDDLTMGKDMHADAQKSTPVGISASSSNAAEPKYPGFVRSSKSALMGKNQEKEAPKSTPAGFSASSSHEPRYLGFVKSSESTGVGASQSPEVLKPTPVGFSASVSNAKEPKYPGFVRSSESTSVGKSQSTEVLKSMPAGFSASSSSHSEPKYSGFVKSSNSRSNAPTSSAGLSGPGTWRKPDLERSSQDSVSQAVSSPRDARQLQDGFMQMACIIESRLQKHPKITPIEVVHQAGESVKLKKSILCSYRELGDSGNPLFQCLLTIDGVLVASTKATNKKVSKHQTYAIAARKLVAKQFSVVRGSDGWELAGPEANINLKIPMASKASKPTQSSSTQSSGASQGPGQTSNKMDSNSQQQEQQQPTQPINFVPNFEQPFFLIENMNAEFSPVYRMQQSADFCKAKLEFRSEQRNGENWGMMWLNGQLLGEAKGRSAQLAKNAAADMGFKTLQNHCWTVQIKTIADSKEGSVSKHEILGKRSDQEAIPEDNKGSIMLRKMGWTGGGVGKAGTGIEKPIELSTVLNREGLGLSTEAGVAQEFSAKIAEVVRVYAGSERQDDLIFSSDFSKAERAIIHMQCKRYGLRSKSQGKKHSRCLVVSRKRSIYQLLQHLIDQGGVTDKYELVPPKPIQELLKLHGGGLPGLSALQAGLAWEDSLALCRQMVSGGVGGPGSNAAVLLLQQFLQSASSTSNQTSSQQQSWPGSSGQGNQRWPAPRPGFQGGAGPSSSTWSQQQQFRPQGCQAAGQAPRSQGNARWQTPMQGFAQGPRGAGQSPGQVPHRQSGPQGWNAGAWNSGAAGGAAGMSGYWGAPGNQQQQQGWGSRADGNSSNWQQQQRGQRQFPGNALGGQGKWQGGGGPAGQGFGGNFKQ